MFCFCRSQCWPVGGLMLAAIAILACAWGRSPNTTAVMLAQMLVAYLPLLECMGSLVVMRAQKCLCTAQRDSTLTLHYDETLGLFFQTGCMPTWRGKQGTILYLQKSRVTVVKHPYRPYYLPRQKSCFHCIRYMQKL